MSEEPADPGRRFELGTDGPKAVVVGVDGSPTSLNVLAYAVGLARREHSTLVAAYARPLTSGLLLLGDRTGEVAASDLEAKDQTERSLCSAMEHVTSSLHPDARFFVRSGDPFTVLTDIAREIAGDLAAAGIRVTVPARTSSWARP
jgi:hypothetical protein